MQRPPLRWSRYPLLKVQREDMILKTSLGMNLKRTDDLLLPLRALRTQRPFLGERMIGLLFSRDKKEKVLPPFHLLSDLKMEVLGKVSRTRDLSWLSGRSQDWRSTLLRSTLLSSPPFKMFAVSWTTSGRNLSLLIGGLCQILGLQDSHHFFKVAKPLHNIHPLPL